MTFPFCLFSISKTGACPDLKFSTVISRLVQSHVQPAQLFFRTSPVSRSSGRFLNENRILPPLAYSTCIQALESLRHETKAVDIHFADEEGDPYAVELAGRLGGYVIGKDSDFVVLNSDGYRGYIPIDEMTWTVLSDNKVSVDNSDDDFQTVRRPKRKTMPELQASQGLVPPKGGNNLSLSFVSYNPHTLAEHLDVPVALLPLLGALVGNDFSKESEANSRRIQSLFFSRRLTLSQRIEQVANVLHSVISPQKQKAKLQVGSVMDLIERTVNALLSNLSPNFVMGSGEIESIIDKIVNATLQYAIPKHDEEVAGRGGLWANTVCALHDPETCSILPIISRNVMRQEQESKRAGRDLLRARELYLDVYRSGLFSAKNMDILNTGSSWARLFLENPDLESVARSIGQPIRVWIYSILDDTVGLEVHSCETAETESNTGEDDDDELIDVVESDGEKSPIDYLAPLKGELERLHCSNEDANDPPTAIIPHRRLSIGSPHVTEYFRSGTRIASHEVVVKPISELLLSISLPEYGEDEAPPVVLRSEDDRFAILLRILQSDFPFVRSLSPDTILPVIAARWVIYSLHSRFLQTGSREREKERWTKNEVRCFLSSFAWESKEPSETEKEYLVSVPIENRHVQLMAQLLMALETIEQLSQVLLLTRRIKSDFHSFSGKNFHALLTGSLPLAKKLPQGVWEGVETELAHVFQGELKQQQKTKAKKSLTPAAVNMKLSVGNNKGSFALLGDLDV